MDNSLKMLVMSAGIFITCIVISFSLLLMNKGLEIGNIFISEANEKERLYAEERFTRFDGELLCGAEIINIIKRYSNEIKIIVKNRSGIIEFNGYNISAITEIEPFDDYIGRVLRNKNNRIISLKFEIKTE